MKRLFLDDLRLPTTTHTYMSDELRKPFYEGEWEIVRNFSDFKDWIINNGLPEFISFDHDLEYECVVDNPILVNDNEIVINQQCKFNYKALDGFDCASMLVGYCLAKKLQLPNYQCHSQNPWGKERILDILDKYKEISKEWK